MRLHIGHGIQAAILGLILVADYSFPTGILLLFLSLAYSLFYGAFVAQ